MSSKVPPLQKAEGRYDLFEHFNFRADKILKSFIGEATEYS